MPWVRALVDQAGVIIKIMQKRDGRCGRHDPDENGSSEDPCVARSPEDREIDRTELGQRRQGAIDIEEIRKEITLVMEGGKEAFRMRKEKYGF